MTQRKVYPAMALAPALLVLAFVLRPDAAVRVLTSRRVLVIVERAMGRVQVAHGCSVFTPGIFDAADRFEDAKGVVHEIKRDGSFALYDTPAGPLWYRAGAWTLPGLIGESQADIYHLRSTIKPGDIVLDVGANVGTDTRTAVRAGAGLVIAIEPEPLALECLRRNLAVEIQQRRVVVVPKGAWNKDETLMLHVGASDGLDSSLVRDKSGSPVPVPLTTIDHVVAELNLPRVDLIKMDIEGAEKNALLGAAETIRHDHPRLAIVLEHNVDDVDVLPALARKLWPGYHVTLTPCTWTSNFTWAFNLVHPQTALIAP